MITVHQPYTLLKFCLFQSQRLKIILQVFQKFIYPLSGSVIHQEYALTSYIFQPLTNHGNIGMRRMDLGDYADHRTKNKIFAPRAKKTERLVCRLNHGVFRQRALETCGGWLVGITVCSQMLFGFLTFYAGMSLAVVLSVLTIRKGLLGIAAFLCTVLPHGLVYLLVWYVLSGWSGQMQKKLHILPGLLLLIITGAGAFLEVFVSPFLWGIFG